MSNIEQRQACVIRTVRNFLPEGCLEERITHQVSFVKNSSSRHSRNETSAVHALTCQSPSKCDSQAKVDACGVGEPKAFALSSYASLFFSPALLPLRHKTKAPAPRMASPPMMAPTAMPAFAPVDSPAPPPEACPGVDDAGRLVLDAGLPDEVGVGALKSSDVTLKQGTLIEKLIVSTKVCTVSGDRMSKTGLSRDSRYQRMQRTTGCCRYSRPRTLTSTLAGSWH